MTTSMLKTPGLADPTVSMGLGLDRLKNKLNPGLDGKPEQKLEALKDAAEQFEALLTNYLLKVMRSTVDKQEDEEGSGGNGKEIYQEMFDNEISLHIARNKSLGIAELLYRQLQDQVNGNNKEEASAPDSSHESMVSPFQTSSVVNPSDSAVHVSSGYGWRSDPLDHQLRFHHGVDVAAPAGSPIYAFQDGRVVFSGTMGEYGKTIIIEHENGLRSLYAHAEQTNVQAGEAVTGGQLLGLVGSSGRSTGSHLHFELQKAGEPLNPLNTMAATRIRGLVTGTRGS
jgi:murein DD-endopeptidase MepM/ murein hydrolase activator NlpD